MSAFQQGRRAPATISIPRGLIASEVTVRDCEYVHRKAVVEFHIIENWPLTFWHRHRHNCGPLVAGLISRGIGILSGSENSGRAQFGIVQTSLSAGFAKDATAVPGENTLQHCAAVTVAEVEGSVLIR